MYSRKQSNVSVINKVVGMLIIMTLLASLWPATAARGVSAEAGEGGAIIGFEAAGQWKESVINPANRTVRFHLPYGASRSDASALQPNITLSEGAVIVSPAPGTPVDFTTPVVYTIQAADGTTEQWTVMCGISLYPEDVVGTEQAQVLLANNGIVYGAKQVLDVTGQPFAKALEVETLTRPPNAWDIEVTVKVDSVVRQNDVVLASMYTRTIKSTDETGNARSTFYFQSLPDFGWSGTYGLAGSVEDGWIRSEFPITSNKDHAPNLSRANFQLGYKPQSIQFGGLELFNYGQLTEAEKSLLPTPVNTYEGREPDAQWRQDALERIEQVRKGELQVRVVDEAGQPVPGAEVQIDMTNHAFHFGTSVDQHRLYKEASDTPAIIAEKQKYEQELLANFNTGVPENALKMASWGSGSMFGGQPGRLYGSVSVNWLRENGMAVRGHNMVWETDQFNSSEVNALKASPELLARRIEGHIHEVASKFKGQLRDWDVVNEIVVFHEWSNLLGKENGYAEWFRQAAQADPEAKLYVNDFAVGAGSDTDLFVENYVDYLKNLDIPVHGVGLESHFGARPPGPEDYYNRTLERLAPAIDEIAVTEFDMDTKDEQLQADYLRDFLIINFSHPKVSSFVMWGFWDKSSWINNGPLFRADWSEKPALAEWRKLIYEDWWTNAAGTTNDEGLYGTRGFLGDYTITVSHQGKERTVKATLPKEGTTVTVGIDEAPGSNADLAQLKAGTEPLACLAEGQTVCTAAIPYGSEIIPGLTAIAADPNAEVKIAHPQSHTQPATIEVTAEDGTTTKLYTVNYAASPLKPVTGDPLEATPVFNEAVSERIDGLIGYVDSSANAGDFSHLNLIVRMNADGFFDVRNGGAYQSLAQVPYLSNQQYHVRIEADMDNKKYDVWVTPEGGEETQIASDYAFRSGAPAIDDLGQLVMKSNLSNQFRIDNHVVAESPSSTEAWYSKAAFGPEGTHALGAANTGIQTLSFDVTPLSQSQVYDLGSLQDISGVDLLWEESTQGKFFVDVSVDGTQWWNVVVAVNAGETANPEPYSFKDVSHQFADVFGRYVRIRKAAGNDNAVRELTVYKKEEEVETPQPPDDDGDGEENNGGGQAPVEQGKLAEIKRKIVEVIADSSLSLAEKRKQIEAIIREALSALSQVALQPSDAAGGVLHLDEARLLAVMSPLSVAQKELSKLAAEQGVAMEPELELVIDARSLPVNQFVLPVALLRALEEAGMAGVRFMADDAAMTLRPDALGALRDNGGELSVTIRKRTQGDVKLKDHLAAKFGERPVYQFSLTVDGREVRRFHGDAPVRLTLPYNSAGSEAEAKLALYYLAENGTLRKYSNGAYDEALGQYTASVGHFSSYAAAPDIVFNSFDDLAGVYGEARDAIEGMYLAGIMNGKSDGQFAPGSAVTRAELASMLVRMLGLEDSGASHPFADILPGDWYNEEVGIAYRSGLIQGTGQNQFRPREAVSRQDMAVMLYNALAMAGYPLEEGHTDVAGFTDAGSISAYAHPAVAALSANGMLKGLGDGSFGSKQFAKRSDVAVVLYRMLREGLDASL